MSPHTVLLLCWGVGMTAVVLLVRNGNVLLAFFVLLILASMRSHES